MSAVAVRTLDRPPAYGALLLLAQGTSAVSPTARNVSRAASNVVDFGERSEALFGAKRGALSQIWALVHESRQAGLEDAAPIPDAAADLAADFIRALPADVPLPEFAWEPDGAISLDWIQSRHRVFSVSVGDTYRLPYAWLDGAARGHGVEPFDRETIPPRILEGIRMIVERGSAAVRSA